MTTTIRLLFAATLAALAATYAGAAPTLPQVVNGQASFSQQGNVFSITNTPGAIINWQSFNVDAGEVTRFIQQSADSAVLNRVLGQDPSKILGALQSNGKVFLINPNGILFGAGSRVDVNGLVASTLNLSDADFLAGRRNFTAGPQAGGVRNDGAITTPNGGQVFLIAPDVRNTGVISAPNGDVVLAAGHSVQLVDSADPDVRVLVSAPAGEALNLGQVIARGGRIGIYGALVTQRGILNADSAVRGENGSIVLKASRATTLAAGSVTSAAGAGDGTSGGSVHVLGDTVTLAGDARVDASGQQGGGTVLVGGDYQGGGTLPHARQVSMDAGAVIRADATDAGNGGKVVLWSEGQTAAAGSISARGSGIAGNGGLVETSGHQLAVDGIRVDAGAAGGKNGTWLLDPYDIEVAAGGTASVDVVKDPLKGVLTGVTKVAPSTLTAAGTDIVLQARHDLTITDALGAAGSVRADAGNNLTVNAAVSSAGSIDLSAVNLLSVTATGALRSDNYIDLRANQMALGGTIAKNSASGGQMPVLTLTSSDASRIINVGTGTADPSTLWLDTAALASLSKNVYEINLGNSLHTGDVIVAAPLTLASNLVLENQGKIKLQSAIDLSGNTSSRFIASLYGGSSGLLQVGAPLKAAKSVLLQGDRIWLQDTVTVTNGGVTLMPNNTSTPMVVGGTGAETGFSISNDALAKVKAGTLTIGGLDGATGGLTVGGVVSLAGTGSPSMLTLDAGAGPLALQWTMNVAGTLSLKTAGSITQADATSITAASLALRSGSGATLGGGNNVGTLAASNGGGANVGSFLFNGAGSAVNIGSVDGINGVTSDGGVALGGAGIVGTGVLTAPSIGLKSSAGIGSTATPLSTATSTLFAYNYQSGGQPINIANQGALTVDGAVQAGTGNTGAIMIDSVGGMVVPVYATDAQRGEVGVVRTQSGDINLVTHSPMTINGQVSSTSGNVSLKADNGGTLTIASGAIVGSTSGSVALTGGTTTINGTVSVSSPYKLQVTNTSATSSSDEPPPPPPPPPTLDSCIGNAGGAGCVAVLANAVDACVANINAPHCGDVLPALSTCQTAPNTAGCSATILRNNIDQCSADPRAAGCAATLPAYDVCATNPGNYGCVSVIALHDAVAACIANPSGAGCAATLPTYAVCAAAPATFGCAPMIAQHDAVAACIANPSGAGCAATLPTYAVCAAAPATFGCAPVIAQHDAVAACIANPAGPGCSATLPSYAACSAAPATFGCSVVVAQHDAITACIANPSGAGCAATLPTYAVCAAAPATYGCAPVIAQHDAVAACIANPSGAGCAATLPTYAVCAAAPVTFGCAPVIAQHDAVAACIANPAGPGCSATLPSYAACSTAPATFGCSVVVAQHDAVTACIANPSGAGCAATLPTYAVCAAAPATYGCAPVIAQHDAITVCMADTKAAGCAQALPALQLCRNDGSVYGCSAVLARAQFDACLANPSGAGCASVLPSLSSCKASSAIEGCAQVLELGFQSCLLHPNDASCSGILPTLGQCVDNKTARGCDVVLPTLDQCIGSPGLQGCSARLPSLATCSQAPSTAGCEAVLPAPSFCSTHPADASCATLTGTGASASGGSGSQQTDGAPVAQAVQSTVQLINGGTSGVAPFIAEPVGAGGASGGAGGTAGATDNKNAQTADPALASSIGAKNEKPTAKNYCN